MAYDCKCEACRVQEYYDRVREQAQNTRETPVENPLKNPKNNWKNFEKFAKNINFSTVTPLPTRNYELVLRDPGTDDGYRLEFINEISVFDFYTLLIEYFGINVELNYDDRGEETLINLSDIEDMLDDED